MVVVVRKEEEEEEEVADVAEKLRQVSQKQSESCRK